MIEVSDKIITYLGSLFGEESAKKYAEFIKSDPSTYIRINPFKSAPLPLEIRLRKNYDITVEPVGNVPGMFKVLNGRDKIGKTVEHITGDYYIQGLSSALPPLMLSPSPEDKVLDLCAAPGSKTTQLGELMSNRGTLIANEISLDRVKMLVYNLDRMNTMNAGVLHYKGEILSKIYDNYFDKILVDAPCSGLGIIQKKGEVNNWWSLERAQKLGDMQLRLLIAAVKMLKTGGEIVYSTCTLTPEENEFIIDKVLEKYPVELSEIEIPIKSIPAFTEYGGRDLNPGISKAKRIIPWETDTDGFFIAKLKKTDGLLSPEKLNLKTGRLKLIPFDDREIRPLLENLARHFGLGEEALSKYSYMIKNTDIFFVNSNWHDNNLSEFERIGTRFGVIGRNGQITLHTQAAQILSGDISRRVFELEGTDEVKKYLEGGILKKSGVEQGQCAVKYKGSVIGTGVVTANGLKSRFPRARRTQEIIY